MAAILELSVDEARYLKDILEMWIAGYPEAIEATDTDTVFETVEQYATCVIGIRDDLASAEALKMRLELILRDL